MKYASISNGNNDLITEINQNHPFHSLTKAIWALGSMLNVFNSNSSRNFTLRCKFNDDNQMQAFESVNTIHFFHWTVLQGDFNKHVMRTLHSRNMIFQWILPIHSMSKEIILNRQMTEWQHCYEWIIFI